MQERDAVCGRASYSLWRFRRSVWPKVEPHVLLSQASDVEISVYNPRHNRAHHVLLYGTYVKYYRRVVPSINGRKLASMLWAIYFPVSA